MTKRQIIFFYNKWIILLMSPFAVGILLNRIFNNTISKNRIAIGVCAIIWIMYFIHNWTKKKIIDYHLDDFLSEIPDVIHPIFLKYDYAQYKSLTFVSGFLKQELFEEIRRLKEKHGVKTHGTNFHYELDDTLGSKKIEVVIEGEVLFFKIFIQTSGSKCAVYEIEKQPNALSINLKTEVVMI